LSVLCIVQARLGSTRLPNKALMDIGGKPLIQQVMERAAQIRGVDDLVLAVPYSDLPAFKFGTWYTRGVYGIQEWDVLRRFVRVLEEYPSADTIMRLTGDCPLLNPRECARVLAMYREWPDAEYVSNVEDGYIDGEDCEVFSTSILLRANREATDRYDREHVTPFIRRHALEDAAKSVTPRAKTSVDTLEELERVRAMVARG